MAFSGDKTWSVTRDDIILAALRKTGEYDSADGPSTAEKTDAALALNALVKEWSAEGIGVWLRQRTILYLNYGQPYYWLGPNPTNDTTNRIYHQACADSVHKEAVLLAAAAAGATVLSITDTVWIDVNRQLTTKPVVSSINTQCGIRLDDGTIHWSYISAVGANSVTINDALPSAAAIGNHVYSFLGRTSRPIRCLTAYRTDVNGIDSEISLIGRTTYERQSNKLTSGEPTQLVFENLITERTSSALHSRCLVWPAKNSRNVDRLALITEHYADDLDSASNNPQFPAEWANALIWNLAAELSFEYGLPTKDRSQLLMMAEAKKANLINSADIENASVMLEPSYGR